MRTIKAKVKKKKKEKSMTRRRKKCVTVAKKIAKIRDKFTCQKCHRPVEGVNCQGSHVISEGRSKRLSCDPLNIKVLCYNCHKGRRHLEPYESGERFKNTFPERRAYLEEENKKDFGSIGAEYFKNRLVELENELRKISCN